MVQTALQTSSILKDFQNKELKELKIIYEHWMGAGGASGGTSISRAQGNNQNYGSFSLGGNRKSTFDN